ncbi:MAG: VanZ family protein [Flavobacteriales bacterium]|nr:VanZ family protein [Flavobacteriales bacterium]
MRIIPALIWTGFIVFALTSEPSAIPKYRWFSFSGADKVVHVILFGIEAFLLSWSLHRQPKFRVVFYVLIWSFVLGGGLELIQHNYIEGRSGDFLDLLADMVGALFGIFGSVFLLKRAPLK